MPNIILWLAPRIPSHLAPRFLYSREEDFKVWFKFYTFLFFVNKKRNFFVNIVLLCCVPWKPKQRKPLLKTNIFSLPEAVKSFTFQQWDLLFKCVVFCFMVFFYNLLHLTKKKSITFSGLNIFFPTMNVCDSAEWKWLFVLNSEFCLQLEITLFFFNGSTYG